MATFDFTAAGGTLNADALFKVNYYKKSENMYNSANVLLGRIKKKYDFTGRQRFCATPLSYSGGVGSGTLPTAGVATYSDALITSKKVYAVCQIEREAIKASANDKGAFVRATKEVVQKCVESYMRNASRILFGSGDGSLGTGDTLVNVAGDGLSVATAYTFTISAATFKEANWEENDIVQIDTAADGDLTVVAVDAANRLISVTGSSTILGLDTGLSGLAEVVYMQ